MDLDYVCRSRVPTYDKSDYLMEQKTNDKYMHVALFKHAYHIWLGHGAPFLVSKTILLFIQDTMWLYDTAAPVNKIILTAEVAAS